MLNTAAPSYVTGQIVTAAQLNALQDGIQAAWTAYTPTWGGATTNPVIGNGSIVGAYMRIGKTVHVRIVITMGSTTTYGTGAYSVSLPVAPVAARCRLAVDLLDTSGSSALAGTALIFGGALALFSPGTTAGGFDRATTGTVPFTFATADSIVISGTYEAA